MTESYTYDANNNLTKVTSSGAGSGWADEYTYSGGLLLKMTRAGSAVMPGKNYWFVYDEMGNPVQYKTFSLSDDVNMTWSQGRYLSSYSYGGKSVSYRYDQNGIRYSKTVNGTETVYYLDGSRIMAEKTGDAIKYYYYDGTGIAAVREGNNFYYVEKNLFGDVVRVYDSAGTVVASYSYDAWGYPLETSGSKADLVPFRYRGYYYDAESGFYYLNSRYYDPEIRRFVNSDNVEILAELSQNLGELNLYSYCNNNPVMHSDPSGESVTAILIVIGINILLNAIDGGICAAMAGQNFWIGALAGGVAGAFVGTINAFFGGIPGMLAGRAVGTTAYGILNEWWQTGTLENMDWEALTADVAMDVLLELVYASKLYPPGNAFSNLQKETLREGIEKTIIAGSFDGIIDAVQTFIQTQDKTTGASSHIAASNSHSHLKYYCIKEAVA